MAIPCKLNRFSLSLSCAVIPCGTSSGHQALLPENTEAKTQILTRQILSDVTHRFPAESASAFVGAQTGIQNSNSQRLQTQSLAAQTSAAANRLRRMR